MYVKHLEILDYRGFSFKLRFWRGLNVLIGTNGSGKTTVLEVIAGLTGADIATEMLLHENFTYLRAQIIDGNKAKEIEVFGNNDPALNRQHITAFKAGLKHRSSFVLTHDLHQDNLITERRPWKWCQEDLVHWLTRFQVPLAPMCFTEGKGATVFMSETGAQRYLFTVGMRRSPENSPSLVDNPERSIHAGTRVLLADFYQESPRHQVIFSTHCPEVFSNLLRRLQIKFNSPDDAGHDTPPGVIDLTNEKNHWAGFQYP